MDAHKRARIDGAFGPMATVGELAELLRSVIRSEGLAKQEALDEVRTNMLNLRNQVVADRVAAEERARV